jgi:NAD(P)-dependent dehydrogenase (short-subunit alcohol dehydrogenase family)
MSEFDLTAGLEDRVVIVTGAAQGIGQATAEAFAAAGARVFATDRNGRGVAAMIEGTEVPARHAAYEFDLQDTGAIGDLVTMATSRLGPMWALAHVAAVLKRQPIEAVTEDDWDLQHDVNLKSGFFLGRAAAESMIAAGEGGRIVNFSSAGFLRGPESGSHTYVVTKGGVIGLTRSLARAYGPHGITVNTVMPGSIDTPMQHFDNPPEVVAKVAAGTALGRLGTPEEVAAVVVFLASSHASFVSGATVMVSGGAMMY